MSFLNLKNIKTIPFIILLVILISTDFLFYLNGKFPLSINYLREILILGILLSFIPLIQRSRFIANKNVTIKLKGLYLVIAGIYFLFVVLKIFLSPLTLIFRYSKNADSLLFSSINSFLYGLTFSIMGACLMLGALFILRDLIYFKRKRFSDRNFNVLVFFIGFQIIYAILKKNGFQLNSKFLSTYKLDEIILYILIVLMVINSLRNSWVNYLNKKQKIHCLWLGIPLILGAIIFKIHIAQDDILMEYSASSATMIEYIGLFLCIYLGMGFLSLLLHLPTAGIFDRKIREIESLHDLSRTLSSVFDSEKIVTMITEKAAAIIKSDALWLQIIETDSTKIKVVSSENLKEHEIDKLEAISSNGLYGWIIQNKSSVLINELSKDTRSQPFQALDKNLNSILGVPLISKKGVLGILFSGNTESFAYDEEDRALLQAFANQATIALENARLFEELVVKERFEQELKVAHDAQRQLLPKKMPKIKECEIQAISVTANEVGGDYYDFFEVGKNKLAIAVGDVSGKGAKAAFYMAELKGIIESLASIYTSPKELMLQINKSLFRNLERTSFISLIYAIIDFKKKELVFTRAGHCPLLYCSDRNNSKFLEPPGLGLGLEYGQKFKEILSEQVIRLHSGDIFVFYTDGVIEARNQLRNEFEQERLKMLVSKNRTLTAFQIKEILVKEIQEFVGNSKSHDDLTFVVVKIK